MLRRDLKNNLFVDYVNSDVDCSFANAAAWNAGRRTIDLWGNNQMVDRFLVNIVVVAHGGAAVFVVQNTMTPANEASWASLVPYRDQHNAGNWAATTAIGRYYAEYRKSLRYVRVSCVSLGGTNVMFGFLTGSSLRNPVDRSTGTAA